MKTSQQLLIYKLIEITREKLKLEKIDILTEERVIKDFFEYFLISLLHKIVQEKKIHWHDVDLSSYDQIAKVYIDLFGVEDYCLVYKDCLNSFSRDLRRRYGK